MKKEYKFYNIIKQGIDDTFFIWKEEMRNVFKDSGVVIFFILVPILYPILYAYIYNNEVVHEAKMVVVDKSDSFLSRELIRRINSTSDVKVVQVSGDMEEAKKLLDEKKAYSILLIPTEFSKDLNKGKQTTLSLYCDMSAFLFYKAFLIASTEASFDLAKDIKLHSIKSQSEKMDDIQIKPVPYESVSIFNPQNGFASFLVLPILMLVIQQTLILGVGMLGGTAREKNRFHTLVPITKHFNGTLRIVFGKSLAYFIIYAIVTVWVIGIVPRLFSFPQIGQSVTLLLFFLPYLFACIFFAITLSGVISTREAPMLVFVFTSVLLLFLSGVSWPEVSLPPFWRALGLLFPSTAGIHGFVRINTCGATLTDVAPSYQLLWIQAGGYFISSCLIYRYQIIRSRKLFVKQYLLRKRKSNETKH